MPKRSYAQMMLRTPPNTPNTRQRTGMLTRSMARDIAINAASNLIPGAGTARNVYNAARVIQGAWKAYKSRQQTKSPEKANLARKTYFGSGTYVSRFRRVKKGGKVSIAKKLGCVLSHEQFGKVNDPDLVCVGHNTWPVNQVALAISYAILRKVLKKAINFDGNDVNQEIPNYNYNDASSSNLVFIWKDAISSTISVGTLTMAQDDTIQKLAVKAMTGDTTSSLTSIVMSYFENETTWHTRELERVLYRKIAGSEIGTLCDVNMLNEVIKLSVSSSIKLQNRTLAADAASADTDRVDAQPLKGKLLKFKGVPKLKNMHVAATLFSYAHNQNGGSMTLIRGAELPTGHLEPKTKQDWTNCYAMANVSLQPGEIKSSRLTMKKAGYINNFFKTCQYISGTATIKKISSAPGYSQLFFFEEVMNSGSSNLITVNYEQQIYISAYLITGRSNAINTQHTQGEYNNLTA